jgi:uncharacterized protein involved in response to NO
LLFLSAVLFVILRDIVAGRNWRNLTIPVVLAMLTALNVLYHMGEFPVVWLDVLWAAAYAVTVMIALIGGTVMESFTGNALGVKITKGPLVGHLEVLSILTVLAVRMITWRSATTWRLLTVWVLHALTAGTTGFLK